MNRRHLKVSIEALRVLDAIDRHGSFSAAAAELCVVTSSITHVVRNIEQALGLAVFDRSGRRARFTAEGRALLERGRGFLAQAAEFDAQVQVIATGWEPRLCIAVDGVVRMEPLAPLMHEFFREAPGTSLMLRREAAAGSWDALHSGRCDLAIGAPAQGPAGGGYESRTLCTIRFVFVVAPGHPLAQWRGVVPRDEVVRHRSVVLGDTTLGLPHLPLQLLDSTNRLTVPDTESKLHAILLGTACGFLPHRLAQHYVRAGRLVRLQVETAQPPAQCSLAWRAGDNGRALRWWVRRLTQSGVAIRLVY